MPNLFPTKFYHSISQERLKNALNNRLNALPGLSRFHLDPERKMPGIWLSDSLATVVEGGHGNEQSDEVIGEFKVKDETIVVKKPVMSIVLELEGLDERSILQHPLLPDQFFYIGDIPWAGIKRILIRERDEDSEKTAGEIAARLNSEFGVKIGVEKFDPNIGLENKWGKIEKDLTNQKDVLGKASDRNYFTKILETKTFSNSKEKEPNKY